MPKVNREALGQYKFPVLPENEQADILISLGKSVIKIDRLIKKTKEATQLSKERGTALISAAVTGKIDVRNITNG